MYTFSFWRLDYEWFLWKDALVAIYRFIYVTYGDLDKIDVRGFLLRKSKTQFWCFTCVSFEHYNTIKPF